MPERLRAAVLVAAAVLAGAAQAGSLETLLGGAAPLAPQQAFAMRLEGTGAQARLRLDIAPGHYLYKHALRVRTAGDPAPALSLPPGVRQHDAALGEVEVYRGTVVIGLVLAPDTRAVEVEYQGCAQGRVCYPPARRTLPVGGA